MSRDPDGRLGFPYTSKNAQYLWTIYWELVPPWQYDAPPVQGEVATDYSRALAEWKSSCSASGLQIPTGAFDQAEKALDLWTNTKAAAGSAIAVTVLKAVFDAATQQKASFGSNPYWSGWAGMTVANARVLESIVTSVEFASAPDPNLARAVWNVAKLAPYGRPGGVTDIPAWWHEKIEELRARGDSGSGPTADALAAAEALEPELRALHAKLTANSTDFAGELASVASKVNELIAPMKKTSGAVRDLLEGALGRVMGLTCTRVSDAYTPTLPRTAQLRGPVTIGTHRISPEVWQPTVFYTGEPPSPETRTDPLIGPPQPIRVETLGGDVV